MASIRDNAQTRFNFLFEKKTVGNLKHWTGKFGWEDPNDPTINTRVVEDPSEKPFKENLETGQVVQQPIPKPEKPGRSSLWIVDMSYTVSIRGIRLPWIPQSISYDSKSKLVAIPSIGRNLPFYHYTGAEDTLEFTIDWFFTDDESRYRALREATKIEALSKSNGYDGGIPEVKLIMGGSNIFRNHKWLVESAPYRLSQWLDRSMVQDVFNLYSPISYKYYGLVPQQIIQEVRLKRISTHNLTTEDIVFTPEDYNLFIGPSFIGKFIL